MTTDNDGCYCYVAASGYRYEPANSAATNNGPWYWDMERQSEGLPRDRRYAQPALVFLPLALLARLWRRLWRR
jgi:hypothetical protein